MLKVDIVDEATSGRPPVRWQLEFLDDRPTLRELILGFSALSAAPQRAVDSFSRNGFVVLVGGRQIEDLDEVVDLSGGAEVTFLRLVPLAGG
ncbi:hypothetical protein ACTI_47570 [Actinoplanes sp. OR16]|uniref:hypothetical protein n=1 Tax=Actinoplanes sp. OR16 TaxID=946334 RepID=UPI000F6DE117|nr:hypothetical protein [Actinoplanes sp. OR16]BBH68072.1 hypothetical protein ACTI_47570 [Actinoplanes sp. OR16]